MTVDETNELIIMLLIENRSYLNDGGLFAEYITEHYDINAFNNRYRELVDKFLSEKYAVTKTEKSE